MFVSLILWIFFFSISHSERWFCLPPPFFILVIFSFLFFPSVFSWHFFFYWVSFSSRANRFFLCLVSFIVLDSFPLSLFIYSFPSFSFFFFNRLIPFLCIHYSFSWLFSGLPFLYSLFHCKNLHSKNSFYRYKKIRSRKRVIFAVDSIWIYFHSQKRYLSSDLNLYIRSEYRH